MDAQTVMILCLSPFILIGLLGIFYLLAYLVSRGFFAAWKHQAEKDDKEVLLKSKTTTEQSMASPVWRTKETRTLKADPKFTEKDPHNPYSGFIDPESFKNTN